MTCSRHRTIRSNASRVQRPRCHPSFGGWHGERKRSRRGAIKRKGGVRRPEPCPGLLSIRFLFCLYPILSTSMPCRGGSPVMGEVVVLRPPSLCCWGPPRWGSARNLQFPGESFQRLFCLGLSLENPKKTSSSHTFHTHTISAYPRPSPRPPSIRPFTPFPVLFSSSAAQ